jgi:hypothetical protein
MSDLKKHTDDTWERFFEFVYSCDEGMTREEVQDDLKRLGVSVSKAVSRVQQALAAAKGKSDLAAARAQRPGVVTQLRQLAAQVSGNLRERLKKVIADGTQGELQMAYFRKLESAATDDDLSSLLDDVSRLDALSEDPASDKPRTE